MKKCALFFLLATWATFAFAGVAVYSPTGGSTASSPVHFAASGSSPNCSKGIGGGGVFTPPFKNSYKSNGAKKNNHFKLQKRNLKYFLSQSGKLGVAGGKKKEDYPLRGA